MTTTIEEVLTEWRFVPLSEWVKSFDVISCLVGLGFAKSKTDARRLIDQGGARIDNVKINDPTAFVFFPPGEEPITFSTPRVILCIDKENVNE